MAKKNRIDTSIAAYHSLDQSNIQAIKTRIFNALKVLKKASSEQLADYLMMPYDSCWKRCSDLKNEGKIYASDNKVLTRKNRFARQWMICNENEIPKNETPPDGPSISDYSRNIQNIGKQLNLL